jgi:Zn-dependent protease with chaperone function
MVAQKNAAEKNGTMGKVAGLFSTHPADDKRIADLKALMPQVVPIYEQNKHKFK